MHETLTKYDGWLTGTNGPAALVLREYLMPVDGHDGVVFPPTFANIGYNIDEFGDGTNVCLIDSVGSQANRIEPIFAEEGYKELIPQIFIKAGEKEINMVEIGHRAGDALARCSELQEDLHEAFKKVLMGDAQDLAKIAPTSLVFGVWDSRDTQAKIPRLVRSTIRAFNVFELTRSAVYMPPTDYSALDVFTEKQKEKAEGDNKSPLAKRGFVHNPASASHGGVIAQSGIRREASLSLGALQQINTPDAAKTLVLRRYIFGLALVALTAPIPTYLRQGCDLVIDPEKPAEFEQVFRNGKREPFVSSHAEAIDFAKVAATAYGVGTDRTVDFDKAKAKADVKTKD